MFVEKYLQHYISTKCKNDASTGLTSASIFMTTTIAHLDVAVQKYRNHIVNTYAQYWKYALYDLIRGTQTMHYADT